MGAYQENLSDTTKSVVKKVVAHAHQVNLHLNGTLNEVHHMALAAASKGTNNTYTLKQQMLKEPDVKDFCATMLKEVEDHEQREYCMMINKDNLPYGTKTILSIWSFKRKQYPEAVSV